MVVVSALSFLQCSDTVSLMSGRTSGPWKPVPLISRGSVLEQVGEENWEGTSQPRFTWKTSIKQRWWLVVL